MPTIRFPALIMVFALACGRTRVTPRAPFNLVIFKPEPFLIASDDGGRT